MVTWTISGSFWGGKSGGVSNVVFTNGAIARENGDIYIYYASCDTRMHVAATTIDRMEESGNPGKVNWKERRKKYSKLRINKNAQKCKNESCIC